jgi:hypothetical protein
MATRIIEYGGSGHLGVYPVVPAGQFVTKQAAMTATSTSALSAALNAGTSMIVVQSDETIYVEIDPKNPATPTATADSYRIQAGGEQFFSIGPSLNGCKVAIKL